MLVKDSEQKTGNDRYEGYNKDLIHEISKILGFNYTIRIVADGAYGSYDKETETWNGMIGELLSQVSSQNLVNLRKLILIYIYIYIYCIINILFIFRQRTLQLQI